MGELTEEEVLWAFTAEHTVNRETLVRYMKTHPKHMVALAMLYHEMMVVRLEEEHGQERARFIDQFAKAIVKSRGKRPKKPTGVTLTEADYDQIEQALSGGWTDDE